DLRAVLYALRQEATEDPRASIETLIRDDNVKLHDSLSHRLSLIAVHAGALSFQNEQVSKEYSAAAETIRQEANAAVQDLRAVLYALRQEATEDPRASIETLIRDDNVKL
ncbi:histidine kinase, partial [Bacteroides fragilis]|nr:histidine kinase [Bacteroides fragilis]